MSRPTLVLLHGVGLDHTVWEPVTALLADRFAVITPDLPGHGDRPPAPAGVTLADLANGVAAEIPAGSHLVGFSLGALVAQHLAVHRPLRRPASTSRAPTRPPATCCTRRPAGTRPTSTRLWPRRPRRSTTRGGGI